MAIHDGPVNSDDDLPQQSLLTQFICDLCYQLSHLLLTHASFALPTRTMPQLASKHLLCLQHLQQRPDCIIVPR